jgi:hypothetical protein
MERIAKHTFTKMNQDISKSKFSPEVYYEGKNIRVITNEDFGSVTNEKGNEFKMVMPDIESNPTLTKPHLNILSYPLQNPIILGHATINNDLYLLSKYDLRQDTAKLFYAQDQNVSPYVDSNIRIIVDDVITVENFDSTVGAVEGPSLPTGSSVRVQSFHLASEPNEAAPDPTLYLEVYKNGVLINQQQASLNYIDSVTLFYDLVVENNAVYFFHAYSLPEPGVKENPFSEIDINEYRVTEDIFTIHKVNTNTNPYSIELLFIDLVATETTKLDVKGFYENQNIQKLYWTDTVNELRFANVADPNLIELEKNFLSTVPNVVLTQPTITGFINGGSSHTAGSIQYAYNLYKLNGAQTKISPLSTLTYLNNNNKGDQVNTRVDKAIKVRFDNLDTTFDRIRLYSIKYNTQNSTPEIRIISEQTVSNTLDFIDDNNSTVSEITFSEFIFLGGDIYYPKHLKIKDNHLFLLNYDTKQFDIDFDARAYRFDATGNLLLTSPTQDSITSTGFVVPTVPELHDAINPTNKALPSTENFNKYIWKSASGSSSSSVTREAFFNEVFNFFGSTNLYEVNYYNAANENVIVPEDPTIVYSNIRNLTTTVYTLPAGLTFISASIDGGSDLLEIPLCAGSTPNYPGNRQWQIQNLGGGQIAFTIQYTSDSRCPSSKDIKSAEIILSDGVTTHAVSFVFTPPGDGDGTEQIQISEFNSGTYSITETTTETTDGVLGGKGPNVEFEIKYRQAQSNYGQAIMDSVPNLATVQNPVEYTGLKSGEVYRLFLEFLTNDGSYIFPKWIADVKIPEITSTEGLPHVNANGVINYPYIETKLLNVPNDVRITGWRTCVVERTEFDRSVVTQGLFNPAIEDNFNPSVQAFPSYIQRTVRNDDVTPIAQQTINKPVKQNGSTSFVRNLSSNTGSNASGSQLEITSEPNNYIISDQVGFLYTPESVLNKSLPTTSGYVRRIGLLKNTFTQSYREVFGESGRIVDTVPAMPADTNLTQFVTLEGANLITNFITTRNSSNNQRAAKYGKLVSENIGIEDEVIYRSKRHAYTRHFGGITYKSSISNNYQVDGNIGFMTPIVNNFVVPIYDNVGTKIVGAQGNIPIMYPNTTLTGNIFKYFGGSSIILTGFADSVLFGPSFTELPSTDTNDYSVLGEIYRVVPNQYGGDTYNARQLNRTIPYSNVTPLTNNSTTTEHQGDTFIQKFNFLKTFKAENGTNQITEIVSFPVETTINLDLRFDFTKDRPDNYDADELNSYGFNGAYSQMNNTIKGIPKPFNFSEITSFPTNVIPSKVKINGELIDSFTDFLINDVKTLDGQYGEITGVEEFKDNLYSFQRSGVAYLAINPRVQLQATDGIPIELGSGRLIERYQYLTTNSGTLNKWSINKSSKGIMYVDLLTKSINFLSDDPMKITTVNGFYNKFLKYATDNYDTLVINNPVTRQGIISHYDKITEDIYFTFLGNTNLTITYNGLVQGFTSFLDFNPSHYINVNNKLITTRDSASLWEHNTTALKSTYYGQYFPSYITLVTNDQPDYNKIFDNIHYNSDFTLAGIDVPDITFNKLKVWNDFQDTLEQPLDSLNYRTTIKRRLRKWNLIIPRDKKGNNTRRDRISNFWSYVQLKFDKEALPTPRQGDYDFTLHDILIAYTPKP